MIKIILVVGARPNFMKAAPILRAFKKYRDVKVILVHTGQHYDYEMSDAFFKDLGIRRPDIHLGIGKGSRFEQMNRIQKRFKKVLAKEQPDYLIVVGDVTSTLACAKAAYARNIKVAHVEAGLRSFDRSMPEEVNRVKTDAVSTLLFVSQKDAVRNLKREGIKAEKIFEVGDVMVDNLFYEIQKKENKGRRSKYVKPYCVLTLHRAGNVDDKVTLTRIMQGVCKVAEMLPVYFPVHPRTENQLKKFKIEMPLNVHRLNPLGYRDFLSLYRQANFVMTDSGGLQLETSVLNVPCLTLRNTSERLNTVTRGTNVLVGSDPKKIFNEAVKILKGKCKRSRLGKTWDGKASERIVKILKEHCSEKGIR